MPLEICGVLSKLNRHFSMAPTVFNVIFNNIWAQRLPLSIIFGTARLLKLHDKCVIHTSLATKLKKITL